MYDYDRRTARQRRHKQRGRAKLRTKKYYRRKKQTLKNKSRRWRKLNKAKVKKYERRRRAQPQLYKMMPAKRAADVADHGLFQPEEDIYLLENEIEFEDPSTDTPDVGFVNWIDLDEGEVHTIFVREDGSRFEKVYEIYEFLDVAALMYEDDEEVLLQALDELHEDAEEGSDEDE